MMVEIKLKNPIYIDEELKKAIEENKENMLKRIKDEEERKKFEEVSFEAWFGNLIYKYGMGMVEYYKRGKKND